ncbi:hypothetical protein N8G13_00435 [Mycoplasma zalophi]|uniref:hypothetical protein n=1 Tax=Mycoplasma zalophi TaxID=191287 RepID=UPI0021C78FF9|nr:hypothetical protein [Mycoplasma zalophi]MCU4116933.1 hypothetical protein [Mycoplasma zalophi]
MVAASFDFWYLVLFAFNIAASKSLIPCVNFSCVISSEVAFVFAVSISVLYVVLTSPSSKLSLSALTSANLSKYSAYLVNNSVNSLTLAVADFTWSTVVSAAFTIASCFAISDVL